MNKTWIVFLFLLPALTGFGQLDKGLVVVSDKKTEAKKIVEGNTYAVIVGIDDYQSSKLTKLNYATADAKAFKEFLQSKAGGEVPEKNIKMYLNDTASTGKIKKLGLAWLNLTAQKNDRVYLYFSGHGITVSGGDSYFLAYNLASDFSVENIEEAGTQALYQLKTNTIRPLHDKGVQVILIMDACRSHLADSLRSITVKTFNPDLNSAEMNAGDIMFLSASNGEASIETNENAIGHGVFTYFLLQGLYGMADNGKNQDGLVTVNKLNNYVTKMVSDYTNETQIPKIFYKGSDNPVIAKVDSNLLAFQKAKLNKPTQGKDQKDMAMNKKKQKSKGLFTSKYFYSDTSGLYQKFFTSLGAGELWGDKGALYYFNKIEKNNLDSNLIQDAVLNLTAVLVDSGQMIVNSYLAVDKGIFKDWGMEFDSLFARGAIVFDTLSRINLRYFPDDMENKDYLQQYYFMKGRSLAGTSSLPYQEKALEYLNTAYKLDTNDTYILHAIDIILDNQSKYQLAFENEKKVITKYPNWCLAHILMGSLLINLDKEEEGLAHYYQAAKMDDHYPGAWAFLGDYYKDHENADSAIYFYQKAISVSPNYGDAWSGMGNVYSDVLKKHDKAIFYYRKAIASDSKQPKHSFNMAQAFKENRNYDSALFYYRMSIEQDPTYKYSWNGLGDIYGNKSNYDSAIYYYGKAVELDVTYDPAWNNLGNVYNYNLKKYDSSLFYYRQAQFYDSSWWGYPYNMASAFENLSKHDSSLFYFWKALQKPGADTSEVVSRMANIYKYNTRDTAGLINLYTWAANADKGNSANWGKLGETYSWANDRANAELAYRKAYSVVSSKKYLYRIVDLKVRTDNSLKEIDVLSKLLDLDPGSDQALIELGRYIDNGNSRFGDMNSYNEEVIDKFKEQNDYKHIASYLRTYIEFDKNNAESWIELANNYSEHQLSTDSVIYFYRTSIRLDSTADRFEAWPELCKLLNQPSFTVKAIQYLEKKKKAGPMSYMLLYNLARCYYYANNYAKAVELLKYAQKNFGVIKQNRDEFIKIPEKMYDKIWEDKTQSSKVYK